MARLLRSNIDWAGLKKDIAGNKKEEQLEHMRDFLLQIPAPQYDESRMEPFLKTRNAEMEFKLLCLRLICTPEYQMC